ncbi:MAG: hypothetical protein Q8O88_03645 [bacterium]|nr:hypothetical protein [bacterium]
MAQKKPIKSLDGLASLLSEEQKKAFKLEEEKREKQLKKALDVTKAMIPGLEKNKLPDAEFNKKYDFLNKNFIIEKDFIIGTDKDGDYIIFKKIKYCRIEETKIATK